MIPAFHPVAEPSINDAPALQQLGECNARLLRHCANLRRLPLYLGECGADGSARATAIGLLHFFDSVLPRQHAALEQALLPALIESMAGSDAVCLHQNRTALALAHGEVQRRWRELRPALLEVAVGQPATVSAQQVEAFIECCQTSVGRTNDELLPMAARLLGDEELQQLSQALRPHSGR